MLLLVLIVLVVVALFEWAVFDCYVLLVGCGFSYWFVCCSYLVCEFWICWCVFLSLDAGCCGLAGFSVSVACSVYAHGFGWWLCLRVRFVLVSADLWWLAWWLLVCSFDGLFMGIVV